MKKETAKNIRAMIEKECQRFSLGDLCENWGATIDEFYLYLEHADRYIDLQEVSND